MSNADWSAGLKRDLSALGSITLLEERPSHNINLLVLVRARCVVGMLVQRGEERKKKKKQRSK